MRDRVAKGSKVGRMGVHLPHEDQRVLGGDQVTVLSDTRITAIRIGDDTGLCPVACTCRQYTLSHAHFPQFSQS